MTAGAEDVKALMAFVESHPGDSVTADLEKKTLTFGGRTMAVEMRESARALFLEGTWDSSATLLAAQDRIRETVKRVPYFHWGPARGA